VAGTLLAPLERVAESNAILEKGARALPGLYILPYSRAFNAFYYDDDWATAGRFAEISARAADAPPHVRQNVLAYYVKGQRAEAAVAFLEESLVKAGDPETRASIEKQLRQALLERDAARLDEAVREWRNRYLIGPVSLQQLVGEGLIPRIPADPYGGDLYVDEEGRVRSSANPYRFARPDPIWSRFPDRAPGRGGKAP
jgi:hypothetical protein